MSLEAASNYTQELASSVTFSLILLQILLQPLLKWRTAVSARQRADRSAVKSNGLLIMLDSGSSVQTRTHAEYETRARGLEASIALSKSTSHQLGSSI